LPTASRIYLVRHAEVTVSPDRPPSEWPLSRAGEAAATRLATAGSWRSLRAVATSPEPKAVGTAAPIAAAGALEPRVDERLREVERGESWVVGAERYRAAVAAYFRHGRRAGWEPLAAACERVAAAVDSAAAAGGDVCIVSHGLALSLHVASLANAPPDPAAWEEMPLPAVAVVAAGRATGFMSVERFLAY
jgi:broad specificity phosphatase PhoE